MQINFKMVSATAAAALLALSIPGFSALAAPNAASQDNIHNRMIVGQTMSNALSDVFVMSDHVGNGYAVLIGSAEITDSNGAPMDYTQINPGDEVRVFGELSFPLVNAQKIVDISQ